MGRFDIVILFGVLHHLGTGLVLEVLEKVLRPGGRVLISDPNGDHPLRGVGDRMGRAMGMLMEGENPQSRPGSVGPSEMQGT